MTSSKILQNLFKCSKTSFLPTSKPANPHHKNLILRSFDRNFSTTKVISTMARPLVMCGPSGSGKSTLLKKLTGEFPDAFGFSVSHTTRKPRPGEEDGVHYHYVEREDMVKAVADGDFIETAEFSGNMYGTSKKAVETVLEKGKICVLDIEMEGVKQVKVKLAHMSPMYAFISPPSMEILEQRLRDRGTEKEDALQKRLDRAHKEMEYGRGEGNFDVIIVNDDLETAYGKLRDFIHPEIEKLAKNGKL